MGTPTPSGAEAPRGRELGAGRGWPTAPPRGSETRPHGDPGTRQAGVKGGTLCLVKKVSDDVLTEPVVFETFSVSSSRHVTVPELTFRRMTPLGRLCALWQGPRPAPRWVMRLALTDPAPWAEKAAALCGERPWHPDKTQLTVRGWFCPPRSGCLRPSVNLHSCVMVHFFRQKISSRNSKNIFKL